MALKCCKIRREENASIVVWYTFQGAFFRPRWWRQERRWWSCKEGWMQSRTRDLGPCSRHLARSMLFQSKPPPVHDIFHKFWKELLRKTFLSYTFSVHELCAMMVKQCSKYSLLATHWCSLHHQVCGSIPYSMRWEESLKHCPTSCE